MDLIRLDWSNRVRLSSKYRSQLDPIKLDWAYFIFLHVMSTKKLKIKEKKNEDVILQKWHLGKGLYRRIVLNEFLFWSIVLKVTI